MFTNKFLIIYLGIINPVLFSMECSSELQAAIKQTVHNEVGQALKSQETNKWLVMLEFVGLAGGMYFLWRKYGWASSADVQKTLKEGVQKNVKSAFDAIEKQTNDNFEEFDKEINCIKEQVAEGLNSDLNKIIQDGEYYILQNKEALNQIKKEHEQLMHEYARTNESLILQNNKITQAAFKLSSDSRQVSILAKKILVEKAALQNRLSTEDAEYEQMLCDIEDNNQDMNVSALMQESEQAVDQIDKELIVGICKLNLLAEQAKAFQELQKDDESKHIMNKIDIQIEVAHKVLKTLNNHKNDLSQTQAGLKLMTQENKEFIKTLKEQKGKNKEDGPVVTFGNKKKRVARLTDGITSAKSYTSQRLGWY